MLIKREDIIVDNSWNYRKIYKNIEELAASIKSEGLKQAPCVAKREDGKYVLTAGYRRLAAIDLLGWTEVDCTIDQASTEVDRRITNLIENVQREGTTFGEEANAIELLLKNGLVEQRIADRLGKSRSWVQERNYYLQMPKAFRDEFDLGKLTCKELRTAYTVYKIHGEEKLYKIVRAVKEAKERGKPVDMAALALGADRKGQRLIQEQTIMQDHLIKTLGLDHPTVKLLGWTLGFISDKEFDDYMINYDSSYQRREFAC